MNTPEAMHYAKRAGALIGWMQAILLLNETTLETAQAYAREALKADKQEDEKFKKENLKSTTNQKTPTP